MPRCTLLSGHRADHGGTFRWALVDARRRTKRITGARRDHFHVLHGIQHVTQCDYIALMGVNPFDGKATLKTGNPAFLGSRWFFTVMPEQARTQDKVYSYSESRTWVSMFQTWAILNRLLQKPGIVYLRGPIRICTRAGTPRFFIGATMASDARSAYMPGSGPRADASHICHQITSLGLYDGRQYVGVAQ